MGKLDCCLANKVYTIKKQYPVIKEFGKRIREVERELNKEKSEKNCICEKCRKPTCRCCVNNRQKP